MKVIDTLLYRRDQVVWFWISQNESPQSIINQLPIIYVKIFNQRKLRDINQAQSGN